MRKLLTIMMALYLAAGVFPVHVMAEEAEEPAEEQTEVTEVVTEEEEGITEEEVIPEEEAAQEQEEEIVPEETAEPVTEEAVPETADPVIEEEDPEPAAEEVVPEVTEEPVIEETVPETAEEPVIEETEVPEAAEGAAAEETVPESEVIPETAAPVIEETVPEPVTEEVIPEEPVQEEAPAEKKKEEPEEVIEETVTEEGELFESEYTITYDANGGKFPDGTTKDIYTTLDEGDFSVGTAYDPYKEGYAFYGWYTTKDMKASTRVGGWMIAEKDMTLYAGYKACYTVTLDVNGMGELYGYDEKGNYVDHKKSVTMKVLKGYAVFAGEHRYYVTEPNGYRFTGWYLDKDFTPGKEAEDYVPTGNITLYAGWEENFTIQVVYHGNGGKYKNKETYTDNVLMGRQIDWVPEFTNSGKVLEGWYADKDLTMKIDDVYTFYPGYSNKTGDPVHLYAKWVSPVKVTLNANGGTILNKSSKSYNVLKGEGIRGFDSEPVRSGYVFGGWYIDKDYTKQIDVSEYPFTSSMTVYAKWLPAVKVTFKGNNKGKFTNYDDEDADYVLNNAVYVIAKGYTFKGSCDTFGIKQVVDGMIVPYDLIPDFMPKNGYTFIGWYKDSDLTKPFSFEKDKITGNMTLYPKVAKTSSLKKYTVTLDPNGGLINYSYPDHYEFLKGEYLAYPEDWAAAPAGKKFAGVTTVKDDASTLLICVDQENWGEFKTDHRVTANMKVYAYYVPVYTLYLDGNGGYFRNGAYWDTEVFVKRTVGKGETITDIYPRSADTEGTVLTSESGKILLGWYSDKACTKLVTRKLHQYPIKKNQTLYAKWGAPLKAGWKKTDGQWWYKCQDGSYYNEGLQKIGSKYYFFQKSGYIKTGWIKIGSNWYYFNTGGDAAIGWKKVGSAWYYFASNGVMRTGWQKISGKWYYLKSSGAMAVGWLKISGKWYYFLSSGAMKTGWLKLDGKWYYLDSSGAMVTGTKVIGGKTYNFNSSGVCLNP